MKQRISLDFRLRKILALGFNWWFLGFFLIGLTFVLGRLPTLIDGQFSFNQRLTLWQTAVTQNLFASLKSLRLDKSQELKELKLENALLRQQLSTQQTTNSYLVLSYPYRLVSNGDQGEIKVGSMVMAQGVLLGFISQVSAYAAKVTLLYDLSPKPILVVTDSGVKGLIKGDGQSILLTEVPHQQVINIGEKIWTVGQIDVAPRLLVGFVDQLTTLATDAVQVAKVKQPVNFSDLEEVEIR